MHSSGPRAAHIFLIADQDKSLASQILEAQGGTLVIPEMGEWPLSEQKVLLGFLKSKSVPHPNNTDTPMLANVRIIGTTSQALEGRAQGGLFNIDRSQKDQMNLMTLSLESLVKSLVNSIKNI
jgi:DNA-binding NtrC family response regulator